MSGALKTIGGLVGDLTGSSQIADASTNAANLQYAVSEQQIAAQQQALAQQRQLEQPWITAGQNALTSMQGFQPLNAATFSQTPQSKYLQDQSTLASTNAASASGMNLSGAQLQALQTNASGLASQDYNTAFNQNQQTFSNLQSIAQMGQAATSNQVVNIGNTANNTTALATGGANALASGMIGGANANAAGISQVMNLGMQGYAINQIAGLGKSGVTNGLNVGVPASSATAPVGSMSQLPMSSDVIGSSTVFGSGAAAGGLTDASVAAASGAGSAIADLAALA